MGRGRIITMMNKMSGKRILTIIACAVLVCATLITVAFAIATSNSAYPILDIYATNLSFSDSIYIKYAVAFDNVNAEDVKLLVWESPVGDYTYDNLTEKNGVALSPLGTRTIDGQTCLIFDYTDIAAKEMTDYVYARAYYVSGGEEYYSEVKKYSVLTYVYNKLGYTGTATTDKNLKALLEGLLEYGAAAQNYINYKTDKLATDKYVKVTLQNGGMFEDGCSTTLAKPGEQLTVIAPKTNDRGGFFQWIDSEENVLSYDATYTLTVGTTNTTLSAVYISCQGGEIDGAGATLSDNSFALTEHLFDSSNATEVTASQLNTLLSNGLVSDSVYRVTDEATVNISSNVNGNNAVIIAPNGVTVTGNNISIKNLITIGSISVKNSSNVTFTSVEVQSISDAITIDSTSYDITVNDCRIISDATAISTSALNTTVKNSYVEAKLGVKCNANENTVYNCAIKASVTGVELAGNDNAANNNEITAAHLANGVKISEKSLNTLITYNKIVGPEDAINVTGATNTVILFNSVYNVAAESSTNTYVVKNSLGGDIVLDDNNYLLCDDNTDVDGRSYRTTATSGNENINGDSLMDVTARNEVGAKEELLPHTNKDLFLEMERKTTVKDVVTGTSYDLNKYVEENAKTNSVVIVPPGAYKTNDGDYMSLNAEMSNTSIYAFGVYNEHGFVTNEEYATTKQSNQVLTFNNVRNVSIHGLTIAYDYQALGQAHILEIRKGAGLKLMQTKDGNGNDQYGYEVTVVPSPGFDLETGWGKSNSEIFKPMFYACSPKGLSPRFQSTHYDFVEQCDDGTIKLIITKSVCDKLEVGSILCTRMAGYDQKTIEVSDAQKILFKDCVINGYSAAFSCYVTGASYDIKYERVHNCPASPAIIDGETYAFYKTLEDTYGLDFEMYTDAKNRYRGSAPRFCSVDATHVISAQGLNIESSLFEQMCDDGSNQHGSSSRLHSIKDNGDGTATIYIKGNVKQAQHLTYVGNNDRSDKVMNPHDFNKGDNIFIYTPGGEIVCDVQCLTNSKLELELQETYSLNSIKYTINVNSVTVPIQSVNFDALDGYDLKDNNYSIDNKVTVDNINYVSANFVIDNYMIKNSYSRGVLTKTVNATIKHSSIINIMGTGVLANSEPEYGEATIPRNITIEKCIIDGTGYSGETWDNIKNTPIYVSGLSTYGEANIHKIVANNIKIDGCHILNYGHQYGICIEGAQNVTITNNVFDPSDRSATDKFVKITTAVNVELSGNKYKDTSGNLSAITGIDAEDYANIHGTDVEGKFTHDFNIYVAGNHISSFKIVPTNQENIIIADILSAKLRDICGYSVAATVMPYKNEIKLVVNDSESELIGSQTYTVECIDGQLVITAESNAALAYAIDDFVASMSELKNSGEKEIRFNEGDSQNVEFNVNNMIATNDYLFKYTGVWNTSGNAMVSGADADYIEFDFTGHTISLLFNGENTFKVAFDGKKAEHYTANGEKTFTLPDGNHTVRIICNDTTSPLSFLGVKTFSSIIEKTAEKDKYIQFVGDSMVDYETSFAHRIGDIIDWDYSVVVGKKLPLTSIARTPDVVVVFLGTDEINSNQYIELVEGIFNTYGEDTLVYAMQTLSPSQAVSTAANSLESEYGDHFDLINENVLGSWNVETDASSGVPTSNGDYTLTVRLANYLLHKAGNLDYINTSFPLEAMTTNSKDMATVSVITEDGIRFTRYQFESACHAYLNGGDDYATAFAPVAGRYLVLMYRASGEAQISLDMRTNDKEGKDQPNHGGTYLSRSYKSAHNVPTEWEIAIVDLSQFEHYTVGLENTKIQLRMTTSCKTFDVAFAAILDNLSEAEMAATFELGARQYRFYEDWSKPGVDISIGGQEIK